MIHIIDDNNREWADAPDLDSAIFAMEQIGSEERIDLRCVDEDGAVLAVAVIIERAFMCNPDESAGAYELDDPKHSTYFDRMADLWDMREGK